MNDRPSISDTEHNRAVRRGVAAGYRGIAGFIAIAAALIGFMAGVIATGIYFHTTCLACP